MVKMLSIGESVILQMAKMIIVLLTPVEDILHIRDVLQNLRICFPLVLPEGHDNCLLYTSDAADD